LFELFFLATQSRTCFRCGNYFPSFKYCWIIG